MWARESVYVYGKTRDERNKKEAAGWSICV